MRVEAAEMFDHRRFSDLIGKGATTQVNVDNAKTQADILTGTIKADQSALDNLKVQKSYTLIRAPFTGRISVANVKTRLSRARLKMRDALAPGWGGNWASGSQNTADVPNNNLANMEIA